MADTVEIKIPELGDKFQDYRQEIPGDSYEWGPVINAKKVQYFAFHHSVTPQTAKNDGNWKAECDKIARLHLAQGWGGIGYRFVIASNGVVAYVGDLSHGGSAVANHNDITFSACMIGDFTKELPTDAQIKSAHILAEHFLKREPAYPLLDVWDDVKGHKDFSQMFNEPQFATACPGSSWPNDMKWRIETGTVYTPQPGPSPVPPIVPVDWEARAHELERAIETLKNEMREKLAEAQAICESKLQAYKKQVSDIADRLKTL